MRGFGMVAALVTLLVISRPHPVPAEEEASAPSSPSLALSPELRAALIEEMQAVDRHTAAIVAATARGDWAAVEAAAGQIAGAFILERSLGEAQRAELHRVLPAEFLALDAWFHREATALADAAQRREAGLVVFRAQRVLAACVDCHARFASARFPGFGAPEAAPAPAHEH